MNKCPVCNTDIETTDLYMVALEKPYVNIFFHRSCYKSIEDFTKFLHENIDNILTLISVSNKKNK